MSNLHYVQFQELYSFDLEIKLQQKIVSVKTQFLDQVKINFTSQLISGIFQLLQKLLKYFTGITTSVSFLPTLI